MQFRKVRKEDEQVLLQLFEEVVQMAFKQDGIDDVEALIEEIEDKKNVLQAHYTKSKNVQLYVATSGEEIIGCISCGEVNTIIKETLQLNEQACMIGCVLVSVDKQGQGVLNYMFEKMCGVLSEKGVQVVYLDCGYRIAQKMWTHKLGEATMILKDYWGEGGDHYIWKYIMKAL